jgi:hypothetical protein
MPGCIVSATTASFSSVEKRRLRATPVITSTLENVSDIGTCLGLFLGPPASAGVRSKQGAVHLAGDTARAATSEEVKELRREASALKEVVAELTLENRLLKKSAIGAGEDDA